MMETAKELLNNSIVQALLIAAVTAICARFWRSKGKLVWSVSHQHFYAMPRIDEKGLFPVRTQQIWVQNVGGLPVEKIEVVLNWKPQHFEVWDPRHFDSVILPDGRLAVTFPTLSNGEFFTISMIDTIQDLPVVLNVRWLGGTAKQIPMGPQRIWPHWWLLSMTSIWFIGIITILYLLLQVVLKYWPAAQ